MALPSILIKLSRATSLSSVLAVGVSRNRPQKWPYTGLWQRPEIANGCHSISMGAHSRLDARSGRTMSWLDGTVHTPMRFSTHIDGAHGISASIRQASCLDGVDGDEVHRATYLEARWPWILSRHSWRLPRYNGRGRAKTSGHRSSTSRLRSRQTFACRRQARLDRKGFITVKRHLAHARTHI